MSLRTQPGARRRYVAGGAMVVAGGLMMATGVGGPIGLALIGAGADTIIQKATTGEVNWGQVALSGAFGLAPGAGAAGGLLVHAGVNAAEGAVENTAQYLISGQPITPGGLLSNAASGAAISTVSAGALSRVPASSTINRLADVEVRPRLPQDVRVNPVPPAAIDPIDRTIGNTPSQNLAVQDEVNRLIELRARNIRVNQQQVNFDGDRVGVNRPDLQYSLDGQRHYVEWDRTSSNRGPLHEQRILANDPLGIVHLHTLD